MATPSLKISRHALGVLVCHAARGFEKQYKKEVGGHLLGYRKNNGFQVSRAIPYNTSYSTRSGWGTNPYYFRKKGLLLETKRLKWIGAYHSHVEIKRSASTGQSKEDKEAHIFFNLPVDIIVRITSRRMRSARGCLFHKTVRNSTVYYYDICGYIKDEQNRIRMTVLEHASRRV